MGGSLSHFRRLACWEVDLITRVRLIQVGNNRNDHFRYFLGDRSVRLIKVSFKVNNRNKFGDFGYCPLNSGCPLNTGFTLNGMTGFYFFKLAQSIWLGCWNKEGIQNLSVVCKIRSCLIVSPSRQDRSISSAGDLPLLPHNWSKKDLLGSVYHHKPFINQAWQVKMARYWPRSFLLQIS